MPCVQIPQAGRNADYKYQPDRLQRSHQNTDPGVDGGYLRGALFKGGGGEGEGGAATAGRAAGERAERLSSRI